MSNGNDDSVDYDKVTRPVRGGCWTTLGSVCRSSYCFRVEYDFRRLLSPDGRYYNVGFRLALRGAGRTTDERKDSE